jgi:hypothetical protein
MPGKNAVVMDFSASSQQRLERIASMLGITVDDLADAALTIGLPGIKQALQSACDTSPVEKVQVGGVMANVVCLWSKQPIAREASG